MNYSKFNQARNIVLNDLEKCLKKVDILANNGHFENQDLSLNALAQIHDKIDLAKRALKYNNLLWEESYKN